MSVSQPQGRKFDPYCPLLQFPKARGPKLGPGNGCPGCPGRARETRPRSRSSLAARAPHRNHKVADSILAARTCYGLKLEGPGLGVGALAAQGKFELGAAPGSRGSMAVIGPGFANPY